MEAADLLSPATLLALALALIAYPVTVVLWKWVRRRTRVLRMLWPIPGPFSVPLLGSTIVFLGVKREDIFTVFNEMACKYLPTMLFWKGMNPEVHLSRAEDIEVILNSTTHIDKSPNYDFIHPWLGDGLLTSKGKKWHAHRKMITPTFHFKILESFVDVFVEKSEILAEILKKELTNTKGFDAYPYITLCALDIICETAMGTQINAQHNSHSEYVRALYDITEGITQRILRPWLHPNFTFYRSARGKQFSKNLSVAHGFTNKVIQQRKQYLRTSNVLDQNHQDESAFGAKRRLAFLDLLLEASREGAVLSDEQIREEVDTFMFEGHDTTSAAMCWALLLLGCHPDVQERVAEELESIFQGSDRPATMLDLSQMKYLERVIKETLRLYPSVPFIARNLKEDVKVDKYTIPAGANVGVRIFHVHRNPEYFPNPEKFDPDNFLPERVQGRHPYAYIPFSAGSRNCIGQKFAILEEKALLSTLIRKYVIMSVDRIEDVKLVSELVLRPAQGVRLRLKPRERLS